MSTSAVIAYGAFDANDATNGADIYVNTTGGNSTPVDATNNWWGTDQQPSVGPNGAVNVSALPNDPTDSNRADYSLSEYMLPACHIPAPRAVHRNAFDLHVRRFFLDTTNQFNNAQRFGLPLPFDRFPYNDTALSGLSIQGYGPNSFTFAYTEWYDALHGIHFGLDYGGRGWDHELVVSVCDGVVVPAYDGVLFGGTVADPEYGVSIRCFAEDPPDPDRDQARNLSNIVVVYNHISLSSLGDLEANDVIYEGQSFAQTASSATNPYDHLDFNVFIADSYNLSAGIFSLNPFLMFDFGTVRQHETTHYIEPYYPYTTSGEVLLQEESHGISPGELDMWTTGGAYMVNGSATNFYLAQDEEAPGIEWPAEIIPRNSLLTELFSQYPDDQLYVGPNCTIHGDIDGDGRDEVTCQ